MLHLFFVNSPIFNSELVFLLNSCMNYNSNTFIFAHKESYEKVCTEKNCYYDNSILECKGLKKYLKKYDNVIFHEFRPSTTELFLLNKNLLSKCNWCCWGHDLYFSNSKSVKYKLYKRIKAHKSKYLNSFIAGFKGDYDYFKLNYGHDIKFYNVIYPMGYDLSTFPQTTKEKNNNLINVMVGHCASDYLQHLKCFDILKPVGNKIRLYLMLNYGDNDYRDLVKKTAEENFEHVEFFESFMPQNKYVEVLNEVDYAMMNFEHQAAYGNILLLLYLKKNIYLSKTGIMYKTLVKENLNVKTCEEIVDDIANFDSKQENDGDEKNKQWARKYLDKENVKNEWMKLINELEGDDNGIN